MWTVFSASATGRRNLEQGLAGQDASQFVITADAFIGIVCDGAGSAPEGAAGARFVSRELAALLAHWRPGGPPTAAEDGLREAIGVVRDRLADLAVQRGLTLHDHACTLVGCIALAQAGCLFHIGDGFAIWRGANGDSVVSLPENGEFADETYFVTDDNWTDHLRVTALPPAAPGCLVGLMTDGTAPFAVNRERSGFFAPFIDPVASFLLGGRGADGDAALRNLLESPRANEISTDDKTLMLAFAT